jgi:hypothetical protein
MQHKWFAPASSYGNLQCENCGLNIDPRFGSPDAYLLESDCSGKEERPEALELMQADSEAQL